MKKLILVALVFVMTNLTAQVAKSRYIKVDEGKNEVVYEAIKAKTQKYNQSAEKSAHYTFYVETGPRSGQLFRARIEQNMAGFDVDGSPEEYQMWNETVSPHVNNDLFQMWYYNENISHVSPNQCEKPLRQVLMYTIDPAKSDDFWTFRKRVYDAIVMSEAQIDMEVWTVGAGNRGLNVLVGFSHENHAEMEKDGTEEWSKVVSAYNETHGEGQFRVDNSKLKESMADWGNSTQLWTFLPELSSPCATP